LAELRGLVELLRPADLSQGLYPALCRLADRINGVVRVHLDAQGLELPESVAETLYRIAQEGIHNALRHAHPKNLWIRLDLRRGQARLRLEDDGRGLPEEVMRGMGLLSLEQRAQALHGLLRLSNRPKGGVLLEARIPLQAPQGKGRG
jgi:two-component system NarL family sensor kinase